MKILLVESVEIERLTIKESLSNYNLITVCDNIEAMCKLESHEDIDLVMIDLTMPETNGLQFLAELKANEKHKKLPAVVLTSYDDFEKENNAIKMGAADYIRKPINIHSLKARIDVHEQLSGIQNLFDNKYYEQDAVFETIFEQAPIGIAISHSADPFNVNNEFITSINPMFEKIIGRSKKEIIEIGWAKITHPDDLQEDIKNFKKLQTGEINSYSMEKRYIKPDGSIVWVYMFVSTLIIENNHRYNNICLIRDITQRKTIENALAESERSKEIILSQLPGMAYRCKYDDDWSMTYASNGCFELTGYNPENLMHNKDISFNDLITFEYREVIREEWERSLSEKIPFKYEYEIMTANGEKKWVLELGQGIFTEQGEIEALEGIILDISDRKEIENILRSDYEHDRLTELYNRTYLENLLNKDAKAKAFKKRAVVSINLSSVQMLTTTYGFHYTQDLIKRVAISLSQLCTDTRQLFNTYENRFVFYLKEYKDKNELLKFCEAIANLLEPLLLIERTGGGIGIVEIDDENKKNTNELLRKLLIASEQSKDIFDKDFEACFYSAEIEEQIMRKKEIKQKLMSIADDENDDSLFLRYQPIFDMKLNRICGFEALARINSDKLGIVTPLEFIPMAEETKLIIPIGYKIILMALEFLKKLKKKGYDSISVSINVSVIQLLKKDFYENVISMINEMQINPENIGIEITESVFASNYEDINNTICKLKNFGLYIAMDDFGTGYSSLARERELSINCLKLDKYFIDKLLYISPEKAITSDIISMAHKFGHCVIAEGVEHERQKEYLLNFGCDKIQGFLIGEPLNESDTIALLKTEEMTEIAMTDASNRMVEI